MTRFGSQVALPSVAITLFLVFTAYAQEVRHDVFKVSGKVIDARTENPIADARLEFLGERLSPVLSHTDGHIEFYLPVKTTGYRVKITCKNYEPQTYEISAEKDRLLKIELNPLGPQQLSIIKTAFQREVFIKGKVTGLPPKKPGEIGEHENLKVVVYVYTDKWYIHPYKSADPGKGYAQINADGSWRISTKFWGHQAFMAAYLVVDKSWIPRSPIAVSDDAEPQAALLLNVPSKAHQIESPAPKGM
jgi:hypothetical protein